MSGNSYFCAFANSSVNDGHISNRCIVNPNIIFVWVWTTTGNWAVAFNLNSKSVRFILCRSIVAQYCAVAIQVVDRSTWFEPVVMNVSAYRIRNSIDISYQSNSIGIANMLITKDSNDRVREYCQSLWWNKDRWFTHHSFRILVNLNTISILLFVTINSHRSVIDSSCITRKQFRISIPFIDIRNIRNTLVYRIHNSGQLNLWAFANFSQWHDNAVDFRSVININCHCVSCEAVRTVNIFSQISNINDEVCSRINIGVIEWFSCTRNQVLSWNFICIPLIFQFIIENIIIIQMWNEHYFTTSTNGVSIRSDVNNWRSHNSNLERFWEAWTSTTVNNFNLEYIVETISRSEWTGKHSTIHWMIRIVFQLTISVPSVDSTCINATVNPSLQYDIVYARTLIANIVLTTDDNDRITTNLNSVRNNWCRNWITIRILRFINFYSINIFILIVIKDS